MAVNERLDNRALSPAHLRYLGAALAYAVAAIHLFHPQYGFPRFVTILGTGDLSLFLLDPRPVAFVLSGLAIIAGVTLVALGAPRKPIYALGIGLTSAYLLGFFLWHTTGHGGFLPTRKPLYHQMGPLESVVSHLAEYPSARLAKAGEAALLVVLLTLYRWETA